MGNKGKKDTISIKDNEDSKKSTKEYLADTVKIAGAAKKLLAYIFRSSPWHLSFFLLSIALIALIPFVGAWVNSRVLDELIYLVSQGSQNLTLLYKLMLLAIGTMLFRTIIENLNTYFEMNVWFSAARALTNDVTKKFAYLDLEYYENPEKMDLLNKVKENYGHAPQQFNAQLLWSMESLIGAVSAISILVVFKPVFVVVLVLTTLPRVLVNVVFGNRNWGIWNAKGEVRRDYWWTRGYLTQDTSLMELKIFKMRRFLLDRTYDLFYNFQKEQIKIENKRTLILTLVNIVGVVGYGILFLLLASAVLVLEISIGQFNFYLSTASRLQTSLASLFNRLSRLYENGLHVADMFEVLELEEKIVSGPLTLAETTKPPKIEFNNVSFKYPGTEKYVFKNLNFVINSGDHIAIVGENGAGKTTLLKLLLRFYDVTEGSIEIDDIDLREINLESWYDKVGTLFQEFNTYHFDAKTNIGVGDTTKMDEFNKIISSAKKSGAHDFIKDYDAKYDQVLSKSFKGGIKPSWGQWQRIALARAFFKDAPILILDEPTSAIDPKAEFEIFEKLFDFAFGKTVLIISHRFSTVRNANQIVVLDKGKIVEKGTHAQLMKLEKGVYRHAFELQRRGYE